MMPEKIQLARNLFRQHDKDHSGYLDADELVPAMNEMLKLIKYKYECTRNEITTLIRLVDKDGDMRLSLKEFMEIIDVFVRTKH